MATNNQYHLEKILESLKELLSFMHEEFERARLKSNPKRERKVLICGYTEAEDCFCVATEIMKSEYDLDVADVEFSTNLTGLPVASKVFDRSPERKLDTNKEFSGKELSSMVNPRESEYHCSLKSTLIAPEDSITGNVELINTSQANHIVKEANYQGIKECSHVLENEFVKELSPKPPDDYCQLIHYGTYVNQGNGDVFDKRYTRGISNRKVLISGYNQDEDCLYVETFEYVQKKLLISGFSETEDCLCVEIYEDVTKQDFMIPKENEIQSTPPSKEQAEGGSSQHANLHGDRELDEPDWEHESVPTQSSTNDHQEDKVNSVTIEFEASLDSTKQKAICRPSAEDKELAVLVHKVLIEAVLLSLIPSQFLEILEVSKLTATILSRYAFSAVVINEVESFALIFDPGGSIIFNSSYFRLDHNSRILNSLIFMLIEISVMCCYNIVHRLSELSLMSCPRMNYIKMIHAKSSVVFYDANFGYGIPEQATSLALKPTRGPGVEESEPYNFFSLDAIGTYVFWNVHEPSPSNYNFKGRYNLVRFVNMVQKVGQYFLQIGPYICAEWNFGELPVWLKYILGINFRTDNGPFNIAMQGFTQKIVHMIKDEKLFESQGGPIIFSQIENDEYGPESKKFGTAGPSYRTWAANMALELGTEVSCVLCKGDDAPDSVIESCNGFYCDYFSPNKPYKPTMWTEAWTSWFTDFGRPTHQLSVEDLAFAVARFIQKGSSIVNYYLYHGGSNFGITAKGPFITTSYDYDAPIDENGLIRLHKYDFLFGGAKNLILAGVKSVMLHDEVNVELWDVSSNFIFTENDVGKSRALVSVQILQEELHSVVVISTLTTRLIKEQLSDFQAVVFVDTNLESAVTFNDYYHNHQPSITFIKTEVRRLFGNAFCNVGPEFSVVDVVGEEPHPSIIASISNDEPTFLSCVDDERLEFQDGDFIVLSKVQGMTKLNDGKPQKIISVRPHSFNFGKVTVNFGAYEFLFHDWNIRQTKSTVVVTAAALIDPSLCIEALQNRVGSETENTFNDTFWENPSVVENALDSVNTRLYVDQGCLYFQNLLLESGTLGANCNIQMIIPHSFSYNIDHCLTWARSEFEDYFSNHVKQIISFTFLEDSATSTEAPFWLAPKHFSQPLQFSTTDLSHLHFVMTTSILSAETFGTSILDWDKHSKTLAKAVDNVMIQIALVMASNAVAVEALVQWEALYPLRPHGKIGNICIKGFLISTLEDKGLFKGVGMYGMRENAVNNFGYCQLSE